jgi:hypothetical protein
MVLRDDTDRMIHYKTLDRIENLVVGVKVYKKVSPDKLVEDLEAKWQELISELTPIAATKSKKSRKSKNNCI